MNKVLSSTGVAALVLWSGLTLVGCPAAPENATLGVNISLEGPEIVGHTVYCSVYDHDAAFGVDAVVAGNSAVVTGNQQSLEMLDPSTSAPWQGLAKQRYDLYVWFDTNDNFAAVGHPETSVDHQLRYFPWEVVLWTPGVELYFWYVHFVITPSK
jgi:hypothetical protein